MKVNPNILALKESATLAINLKARAARNEGREIAHLGFGQSPFPVPQKIQEALRNNAHQKDYLPTRGLPELCEAIATYQKVQFKQDFSHENIIIGPGSKELIFQAIYCLEGEVFVPAPSWVSYGPQLNIKGKQITVLPTGVEDSYKISPEQLDKALVNSQAEQKVLIFNNPSNPTGAVYEKEEIEALSLIAKKHNLIIISDEIYGLIKFDVPSLFSFHHYYPEGTIVTGGLSKSHGAGGYRLGFMALPTNYKELMKAMCALISETFSAVSAPIQYAALTAYSNDPEIMKEILDCTRIHRANSYYCFNRLRKMGVLVSEPKGAFYLFPQLSPFKDQLIARGIKNDKDLAHALFDQGGVACLPGSDFYFNPDAYALRISPVDYDGEEVYNAYKKLDSKEQASLDGFFVEQNCSQIKYGMDQIENFLTAHT